MNHALTDEIRAGFILLAGLAMLAMICAVAALGTVMRPLRWAERRGSFYDRGQPHIW